MNSRKLFALFLVLALTGSALALTQQRLYRTSGENVSEADVKAEGVVAVQQHTVFVEIIVEKQEDKEQIHQFAAVVGLVKTCSEQNNRVFDNAVLWFNDQFLFGDKDNNTAAVNVTPDFTENFPTPDPAGDVWEGCFSVDGFMHAIGSDDPYATGALGIGIPIVKELIALDNTAPCNGCIFEYVGSFYVTDPNGVNWLVDKLVYPLEAAAGLAGVSANCHVGPGSLIPVCGDAAAKHRDTHEDNSGTNQDNHCFEDLSTPEECDEDKSDPTDRKGNDLPKVTTMEPIYTVRVQVDSADGLPFKDGQGAAHGGFACRDGTTAGGSTGGTPYHQGTPAECASALTAGGADNVLEYNFLIAVDFEAFENTIALEEGTLEDEIERNGKQHGSFGADSADRAWQGNSHPHNTAEDAFGVADTNGDGVPDACTDGADGTLDYLQPIDTDQSGVIGDNPEDGPCVNSHKHDTVGLDLFFMSETNGAPFFVADNPYWDAFGAPPTVTADCEGGTSGDPVRDQAIVDRDDIVCDVTADDGFHLHDGSQTIP